MTEQLAKAIEEIKRYEDAETARIRGARIKAEKIDYMAKLLMSAPMGKAEALLRAEALLDMLENWQ